MERNGLVSLDTMLRNSSGMVRTVILASGNGELVGNSKYRIIY